MARRIPTALSALLVLIVNVIVAAPLFGIEYSAYNGSIEGTLVAIPRLMARYPGQWQWFPFWNDGLPFEAAYLPLTHWIAAALILIAHISAGHAFHIVSAAFYVAGALALFWMTLELSGRLIPSLISALAYSCISPCALLISPIAIDSGGALNLRRLQVLVTYGEAPHNAMLAILPVAIVCFWRAMKSAGAKWKILAGVAAAAVFLSNAFGLVMLPVALLCLAIAYPRRPWWQPPAIAAAIGIATYCWISPWLSPAMIRAIRANAATVGGDFRYRPVTYIALAAAIFLFTVFALLLRRSRVAPHLQFFALLAFVVAAIVGLWYLWGVPIVPQPTRYQLDADLVFVPALVFGAAAVLDRWHPVVRRSVAVLAFCLLAAQSVHSVVYAHRLIRAVDPTSLSEYKISEWIGEHRPGERAFLAGSSRNLFNDFTDNPQLEGGHNQHTVNTFVPIVEYAIFSDQNAGIRGADYSIFWLKAFGTHLIAVSGEGSTDAYKALAHPHKFDGVLPLLWRDGGDSIYEVPVRSKSLAHVIPASAVVTRRPYHGLDIGPVEPYVAAIEDARYALAKFEWKNLSEARISATVEPGQVVAVQVTYERGWEAWANGRSQTVRGDGIGQLVIEPDCVGPCTLTLRYTGRWEHLATRSLSLAAMCFAILWGRRFRLR